MVCKEDVCLWFRSLNGPKRIDLLCGLLQLCLPPELRFVASCVEELAKKDFHSLRDAELRANDDSELCKMARLADLGDPRTRSKIITYLALLSSHNIKCANILYDTLTSIFKDQALLRHIAKDSKSMEELLLMLTMATNHPAFTFSQKQALSQLLALTEHAIKEIVLPPHVQYKLAESDDPPGSPHSSLGCNCRPTSTCRPDNVVVRSVECKGSQWQGTNRRTEYHVQISWSNGEVTEAYKTYTELSNFHSQLLTLFPKESGAHKQERNIPFFPQEKGNGRELNEQLKKYFRLLSGLPHILQCGFVTSHFSPTCDKGHCLPGIVENDNSKNPSQPLVPMFTVHNSNLNESPTRSLVVGYHGFPSPQGIQSPPVVHHAHMPRGQSPQAILVQHRVPSPHAMHSPVPSFGSAPSPTAITNNTRNEHGVMQGSPGTPASSPSSLCHANQNKNKQAENIARWLKSIRLHKYTDRLTPFTFEELQQLNEKQLEELGLVPGARKKLLQQLKVLRAEGTNGLVCPASLQHDPNSAHSPHRLAPDGRALVGRQAWGSQASTASSFDSCSTQGSEVDGSELDGVGQEPLGSDDGQDDCGTPNSVLDSQLTFLSIREGPVPPSTQMFLDSAKANLTPNAYTCPLTLPDALPHQDGDSESNQSSTVVMEPSVHQLLSPLGVHTGMPPTFGPTLPGNPVVLMEQPSPPGVTNNQGSSITVDGMMQPSVHVEAVVTMPMSLPQDGSMPIVNVSGSSSNDPSSSSPEDSFLAIGQVYMVTTTNVTYTITPSFAVPSIAKHTEPGTYSSQQQPVDARSGPPVIARQQGNPNTTLIYACTNMAATGQPLMVSSREQPCIQLGCSCNQQGAPSQQQPQQAVPQPTVAMLPPHPTPVSITTPVTLPPHTHVTSGQQYNWWPHHLYAAGFTTVPSHQGNLPNGMVSPAMPSGQPLPPGLNGINPDLLYNPTNYSVIPPMGMGQRLPFFPPPMVRPGVPLMHNHPIPPLYHGKPAKCKEPMCHNCGGNGHWATECPEPTMETVTYSGHFHMNFHLNKPSTEVE